MPRLCKLCALPNRAEIDQQLVAGEGSYRRIAVQCSVSPSAVRRHASAHIPRELARAQEARELADSDSLLDRVRMLAVEATAILAEAKASKHHNLALRAIDRAARLIELQARLVGELAEGTTTVNLNVTGEAARIVACVVSNVSDVETRLRIAEALREVN